MVAALKTGRNSIGIELDTEYCRMAASRLMNENGSLFSNADLQIQLHGPLATTVRPSNDTPPNGAKLQETAAPYRVRNARKAKRLTK